MSDRVEGLTVCLGEDAWLDLPEFARVCGTSAVFIEELIGEGVLIPRRQTPALGFGGEEIARVRRIRRLLRDFEASLPSVAVMIDLIDEVERLRRRLRSAGIDLD